MYQKLCCFLTIIAVCSAFAQQKPKEYRKKQLLVTKDTLQIDTLSINAEKFKLFNKAGKLIPKDAYQVDFAKAQLIIDKKTFPEITVEYYRYPDFLTKIYSPFDSELIVENSRNTERLFRLANEKKKTEFKLFDGLKTSGFIARGLTSGNNQNAVTTSSLDLTIEGKLSNKVGIRANIFDTNIPLQQNGYSQNITDFDRIFVELFSDDWRIKGGDLSLKNSDSYFLNFEKQVAGIEVEANISDKFSVLASGAVVRGRFTSFNFMGIEGNQGPYKLLGANNESAIIIVAKSEKVFVNGIQLHRGESKDYIIDYNLGEIQFNTKYPITNDMRIRVEFQYSNENYTRFVTYEKASYTSEKFNITGYFYNENDFKNQPIQQSLTNNQKQQLANAGNDINNMFTSSAYLDTFSPDRIQYKKVQNGTLEYFEFTTNENDEVYSVSFSNLGTNQGSYAVDQITATGTVYKYVGENLGNYAPVIQLIAPNSLQIINVKSNYSPSEKTHINTEVALSNNDANLFSNIDDEENKAIATKVQWKQQLLNKNWKLSSVFNYKFIEDNFKTVQRFQAVEFNRDWNLVNPLGNQQEYSGGFYAQQKDNFITYSFNRLSFDNFTGNKHVLNAKLGDKKTRFSLNSSLLNNSSTTEKGDFLRLQANILHDFSKKWIGARFSTENNAQTLVATDSYNPISHEFKEYEAFIGVGDTTKVFAKFGGIYRTNDSIKSNAFARVNTKKTLYVNSQLVNTKNSNLNLYANYRITENVFFNDEKSLNSRVAYRQFLFNKLISSSTIYETASGNIARQDYVYVKTEPGQGYYTWIDYNNDGIQDFNEFEIAQFQDQADYLRVPLPNISFVATQKAKLKQSLNINFGVLKAKKGLQKLLVNFYNQSYLTVENERERSENSFHFNPFEFTKTDVLALQYNFRNSFYFKRNQQHYSWIYTYGKSRNKQQFAIGSQENNSEIHQLEFAHKLTKFWLFETKGSTSSNNLETENLADRNYRIEVKDIQPKLSYVYNKDHRFSVFYNYKQKENTINDLEALQQQKIGLDYFYLGKKKQQIQANFTMFLNDFSGNANSPVGYQMLEGLQTGRNYTWNVLFNQRLNSFLNLNLNYLGRKSEESKTIHTGTVQLKAIF